MCIFFIGDCGTIIEAKSSKVRLLVFYEVNLLEYLFSAFNSQNFIICIWKRLSVQGDWVSGWVNLYIFLYYRKVNRLKSLNVNLFLNRISYIKTKSTNVCSKIKYCFTWKSFNEFNHNVIKIFLPPFALRKKISNHTILRVIKHTFAIDIYLFQHLWN